MFGIGAGELLLIAVVALLAVGPDKLPGAFKAVAKGIREFRRTTNELRRSTGIDELLESDDIKELRQLGNLRHDPLGLKQPKSPAGEHAAGKPGSHPTKAKIRAQLDALVDAEEQPPEGVDLALAASRLGASETDTTEPSA